MSGGSGDSMPTVDIFRVLDESRRSAMALVGEMSPAERAQQDQVAAAVGEWLAAAGADLTDRETIRLLALGSMIHAVVLRSVGLGPMALCTLAHTIHGSTLNFLGEALDRIEVAS